MRFAETQNSVGRRLAVTSWSCSVLLHLLCWGAAGWIMTQETLFHPQESFHWDVAIVEPSEQGNISKPLGERIDPAPSKKSPAAEVQQHDSARSARRKQEQPIPSSKPIQQEEILPPPHRDATMTRFIRAKPEAASKKAVEQAVQPESGEDVDESAEEGQKAVPMKQTVTLDEAGVPKELVPTPTAADSIPEGVKQTPRMPVVTQEEVESQSTYSSAEPMATGDGFHGKADFGWLIQMLWSRVMERKLYPHEARVNHWEGQVIVRVVLDEHGQLVDVAVVTGSGHDVLDHAALEIIKQSCPITLPRALGRSQVVLRVPIQYRLDS